MTKIYISCHDILYEILSAIGRFRLTHVSQKWLPVLRQKTCENIIEPGALSTFPEKPVFYWVWLQEKSDVLQLSYEHLGMKFNDFT